MAKNNAINLDVTPNADGFTVRGGTTPRSLTVIGGDITLTGGATTKGDILASDGTDFEIVAVGTDGKVLMADAASASGVKWETVSGTGDVVGPASATNTAVAIYDGTTGKLIKNQTNILIDSNGRFRIGGADGSAMVDVIGATDSIQGLRIQGDATDAISFSTYVAADSFLRFSFLATGELKWGGGSGASDTNLYRSAANTLKTDDALEVTGVLTTGSTIELGNASDTTLSRVSAGVIAVEGVTVPTISSTNTLTNKRVTPRVGTTTSSATPTINTDNVDAYHLTAQTADITSFTTNLTGTPTDFQQLRISVTGTAARAITWGSAFANGPVALPTTTVTTTRLDVLFQYDTVTSKWRCMASGSTV